MKDVILVFPPDFREINEPCVTLPPLKAYLQQEGLQVQQIDANVNFYNYITERQGFADLYRMAAERFRELDNQELLNPFEQSAYKDLAWLALTPEDKLWDSLQRAKKGLKDHARFYNFTAYYNCKKVLNALMAIPGGLMKGKSTLATYSSLPEILPFLEKGTPYDDYIKEILLPKILSAGTRLVSLSLVASGQIIPALVLARELRKQQIHVNIANYVPTLLRKELTTLPAIFDFFDSVIVFEEERPLIQLAKVLRDGGDLSEVNNLIYRDSRGEMASTRIAEPVPLDAMPTPDFDDFDLHEYFTPDLALPILSSRGCYWGKCKFCSLHRGSQGYDQKAPELVVRDLENLVARYKTNTILFFDTVMNPEFMVQMASLIVQKGLDVNWTSVTRVSPYFTAENAALIYASGCRMLEFEYETAKQATHQEMETGISLPLAGENLQNTSAAGIINTICLLYGLPGESLDDFKVTNGQVLANKEIIHATISFCYHFTRESILWNEAFDYGLARKGQRGELAHLFHDYLSGRGAQWKEREEGIFDLFEKTKQQYPYFHISYYPIIHYSKHYGISNPLELVTATTAKSDFGKNSVLTLQNAQPVKVQHDLLKIRNQFVYMRSGDAALSDLSDSKKGEYEFIYNHLSNGLMAESEDFKQIKQYIDGKNSIEHIVEQLARDSTTSPKLMFIKKYPLFLQYRLIIEGIEF